MRGSSPASMILVATLVGGSCVSSPSPSSGQTAGKIIFANARLPGGQLLSFQVDDGVIVQTMGDVDTASAEGRVVIDLEGGFVVPAVVDSHVHLAYYDVADELVEAGIGAVVDLAAPLPLPNVQQELEVLWSGPMITAVRGYPTQSWGSDGYGAECASAADAVRAVELAHDGGARVIKIPFGQGPALDETIFTAAVRAAHDRNMKVIVHALSDVAALRARQLGADVLAHTPTRPLLDDTIAAWSDGVVISTLGAFGGSDAAVDNLARLDQAGTLILYGTDLGNTRDAGIQAEELALLKRAGLSNASILASMTGAPADHWGLKTGHLRAGAPASFLVLDEDPLVDVAALLEPRRVFSRGRSR